MHIEPLISWQIIPWLCLIFTISLVFIKPKFWPYGSLITLVVGFVFGVVDIIGVAAVSALFALSYGANKLSNKIIRGTFTTLVIVGCVALAAHLLPGFNNLLVLDDVQKSINSIGFTMYLNFDKPMILFALLLLYPSILEQNKVTTEKPLIGAKKIAFVILAISVIFVLAFILKLIKPEPSIPSWWWLFALNNLLLTCVAEEVFFRGYIQQKVTKIFSPIIGICVASVLFGVAHFAGGVGYVIVATLAGILYGLVYNSTGKVSYAILIHFVVNLLHLFFFTYPLARY